MSLAIGLSFVTSAVAEEPEVVAEKVARRIIGNKLNNIVFEMISTINGHDCYETVCTDGKLTVRGSSAVTICRGFHDYLRKSELGMVGWAGARITIPKIWPDAPLTKVQTPFKLRHCYNAVTAGYTQPYWTWERWEQELDWLAMHGYNMIMAPVATEAIATRIWQRMGITQQELDEFYVGPAHLPWQRMGCIRDVDHIPQEWHQDQIILQKKILTRMRELGIEPIIQSFAGFVPPAIKRIHPGIKLHDTLWNGGFPKSQRPVVMMPDNPLFTVISKDYIKEWKKEFGDCKYYLVDSFNEMHLPKTELPVTELLAKYGANTFKAITAGDPDGIWVIQGWMFNYQRYIWNKDTVKALLGSVPDDRMLILDYANDYKSNWDAFNGFHGKPWLMGYVPNMGGKTAYTGKMHFYAKAVSNMLKHPSKGNNVGFTISGEGLENNQVLYELMSDTAWTSEAVNLDLWLESYSRARYGNDYPEEMKTAWDLYRKTCFGTFTPHPTFGWQKMRCAHGSVNRDPRFTQGVKSFLACRNQFENSASYQDDAVEMAAISLSLKADEWFIAARKFYEIGDVAGMQKIAKRGFQMLLDIDRLLESHSLNRLDRWIGSARQHSNGDSNLDDQYERNARHLITTWGPPVNDYAARMWSGLIRDFYQPRMEAYFDNLSGKPFNRHEWEANWVNSIGISQITPFTDPVEKASELVEAAYAEKLPETPKLETGDVIGEWTPTTVTGEWKPYDWTLTEEQLKELKGVSFIYQKGHHRLDIKSVALIADGRQVAIETHNGEAGDNHKGNIYLLKIPKEISANNGAQIRAVIRSTHGANSYGSVQLIRQ